MNSLLRALHAEVFKLRRTLAFRMVFVTPALVALLQFFIGLNQRKGAPTAGQLRETVFQNILSVWAIFMLPLFITLETALLTGIEHGERQWKHLLALPLPRHVYFLAKFVVAALLAGAGTLVLCVYALVVGFVLVRTSAGLPPGPPPEFGQLFLSGLKVWVAAWLIVAIHSWVSLRWSSFTLALGTGVGGTFFALFAASAKIGKYYPWLLPVNALNLVGGEPRDRLALLLGGLGGALVVALGSLEFSRKDGDEPQTSVSRRFVVGAVAVGLAVAVLAMFLQSRR
jgi:hypothetical protein